MKPSDIVELMNITNTNLTNFITLQNQAMGGGSLRSIFKKIDFGAIYARLSNNTDVLKSIRERLNDEPGEAIHLFLEYLDALINAQITFSIVVVKLYQKSQGEAYPALEYKNDLAKFKRCEQDYLALGQQMNRAYQMVLGEM
jgi:hypothetical protein